MVMITDDCPGSTEDEDEEMNGQQSLKEDEEDEGDDKDEEGS